MKYRGSINSYPLRSLKTYREPEISNIWGNATESDAGVNGDPLVIAMRFQNINAIAADSADLADEEPVHRMQRIEG
jgi:hypothetical protein